MNDFDYDVMQKKRIAHSARHMKRGSKSRKCTLPSDHMTDAEWKRRNGTVNTYNMNLPMTWEAFKALPHDLQQMYLDHVQDRFGATTATISKELFGLSIGGLRTYLNRQGLKTQNFGKGHLFSVQERLLWDNWLNQGAEENNFEGLMAASETRAEERKEELAEMAALDPEREVEEAQEVTEPKTELPAELMLERAEQAVEYAKVRMTDLTATFKGEFDAGSFVHWISKLPMPDGFVKIRVEVEAL